ncbi:MAG: hypothetical protein IKH31_03125 [Clostridia bacterium]|nr:hypothetical protein [Clostridia bacterium]MBR6051157.1 hypothetical protein [Clostridia bacterium]
MDALILAGSPLVVECKLKELVRTENFSTVIDTIVDVAADESVLDENGKVNAEKLGLVMYDSISNSYFTLGEKVGKAWSEGKRYLSGKQEQLSCYHLSEQMTSMPKGLKFFYHSGIFYHMILLIRA